MKEAVRERKLVCIAGNQDLPTMGSGAQKRRARQIAIGACLMAVCEVAHSTCAAFKREVESLGKFQSPEANPRASVRLCPSSAEGFLEEKT